MATPWITADDLDTPADPRADEAAEAASWVLYRLSGERYSGIRTATEWYGYERANCWCGAQFFEGDWTSSNFHIHMIMGPYGVANIEPDRIRLRHVPVETIVTVRDHVGLVDSSKYTLEDDAYLVRTDCIPWTLRSGIEIQYSYGTLPPAMGRSAAIKLANQFLLAYSGSDACVLPERVQSITRQGVSMTILDPQTFLDKGLTGIYEVDLFISVANPSRAKKRAKIFSPDFNTGRRRR